MEQTFEVLITRTSCFAVLAFAVVVHTKATITSLVASLERPFAFVSCNPSSILAGTSFAVVVVVTFTFAFVAVTGT